MTGICVFGTIQTKIRLPHIITHSGTAAHRGLQQPDGGLGWALLETSLGHRSQPGDTGSHKYRCSQSHYKPGELSE